MESVGLDLGKPKPLFLLLERKRRWLLFERGDACVLALSQLPGGSGEGLKAQEDVYAIDAE